MSRPDPIHLRPTAELAPRALLPGDPGRALALAQRLIERPRMFNHHRGLWGYTGAARADGEPLTIQSTGMGGPSAAIVLEELIALGLQRAVRVGTCGALQDDLRLGEVLLAQEAIAADGVGRMLGENGAPPAADPTLSKAIHRQLAGARAGTVVSTDLFYEPGAPEREALWSADGALAVEMEAAALFAVGTRREVAIACLLAVSDVFSAGQRKRIDDELLLEVAEWMGSAAVIAMSA